MPKLSKSEQASIKLFLSILKAKHPLVAQHVLRTARLSTRVAKALLKDTKAAYMGAIFHDIGKTTLHSELFDGGNISHEEYLTVQEHAMLGYHIKDLPFPVKPSTLLKILEVAAIVSICDFIDAFSTRKTLTKDPRFHTLSLEEMLMVAFPYDQLVIKTALLKAKELYGN